MTPRDEANAARDKDLRRAILETLDDAKGLAPRGGMHGRALRRTIDSGRVGDRFESDGHFLRLCRDLAGAGFVTETDERTKVSTPFEIDDLFFVATSLGSSLRHQLVDKHPLVADDRR